jgi:putative endopeptidase
MRIETALAKASKTPVERRDPAGIYNKVDRAGLATLAPAIDWDAYFATLASPSIVDISVEAPKFITAAHALLGSESVAAWRNYLTWNVLASAAPTLPRKFADEAFELEKVLRGTESQRPRWKRCVSATDRALTDLLARRFVDEKFSSGAKTAAVDMVVQIRAAFAKRVDALEWMSDATRTRAHEKLEAMELLVGYPDTWKSYDFEVSATSYAANTLAARAHALREELAKVGKPFDRTEWPISAALVNAGYNPLANHMVFPAGILQPRFFDEDAHFAVNLGGLGLVVGHELTHGFDDQGRQFDAKGNLSEWWTAADAKQFKDRAQCVVDHYGAYEALPGEHINGQLTLGENIADIGGALLSYDAYRALLAQSDHRVEADGLSEDQMFFLAIGQAWCDEKREPELRRRLVTDPHSPPRYRIQGVIENHPAFAPAFSCKRKATAKMCSIW